MDTPANTKARTGLSSKSEAVSDPLEIKRLRRASALKAAEGLWKDRTDIPKDGVEYQNQLRAEWP